MKNSQKEIKAFIWDLDGVITDTSSLHREAWIEALKKNIIYNNNPHISEKYDQFFSGVPRMVGIKRFLDSAEICGNTKEGDPEKVAFQIANLKNNIFKEKVSNLKIKIYDDALQLMRWSVSKGIKNGLASQSENADLVLMKTNLNKFLDAAATGITAKNNSIAPKPNPEFYRHAANLLNVNISDCIVFEDTYAGAFSAVAAGARICVGVARSQSSVMELASAGCDIITRDLKKLKNFLNIKNIK